MIEGYVEQHGDGIHIQRVWCLCPLFLVEEGVGSDVSA